MIDENLAVPFETTVLGAPVTVERLDLNHSEQIVAVAHWKQPTVAPYPPLGRLAGEQCFMLWETVNSTNIWRLKAGGGYCQLWCRSGGRPR
jgi:hypothetical protein